MKTQQQLNNFLNKLGFKELNKFLSPKNPISMIVCLLLIVYMSFVQAGQAMSIFSNSLFRSSTLTYQTWPTTFRRNCIDV